jgi:hypothetical protein
VAQYYDSFLSHYKPIKEKGSKKQIPEPQKRKYEAIEPENMDKP